MSTRPSVVLCLLILSTGLSASACQDDGIDVREEFPPPRLAVVAASHSETTRYLATTDSSASFTLEARKLKASGRLQTKRGWLSIDTADTRSLRGELVLDWSTLQFTGEGTTVDEAIARKALELDEDESRFGTVRFNVDRVLATSSVAARAGDVSKADDRVRHTVDLTLRGQLELHGFRVEQELDVEVAFLFDQGAPRGTAPARVELTTRRPLRLPLAPFRLATDAVGLQPEVKKLLRTAKVEVRAAFLPGGT